MYNFVRIVAVRVSTTLPTAIFKTNKRQAQATSERAEGII